MQERPPMMNLERLKRLIDLASDPQVAELEVKQGDFHLKITPDQTARTRPSNSTSGATVDLYHDPDDAHLPLRVHAESETVIQSPLYGLFHASAAPDQPAFVELASKVSKGDTLGMVESMKMLHPVTAPHDGTITQILIGDEADVVANQPLFALSPA
nr:biotin/lipoyl-containing protein [uncultured Cohaesibacter sp.]